MEEEYCEIACWELVLKSIWTLIQLLDEKYNPCDFYRISHSTFYIYYYHRLGRVDHAKYKIRDVLR